MAGGPRRAERTLTQKPGTKGLALGPRKALLVPPSCQTTRTMADAIWKEYELFCP
jgi:hypothetical protein